MAAFRVRQRSASPQHDDLHCIVPFSSRPNIGQTNYNVKLYDAIK
jgi:hypothetical protein